MLAACDGIAGAGKTWILNQCSILGADMDDDVMDQRPTPLDLERPRTMSDSHLVPSPPP